ncbi:MAG: hypothetical protein ABJL72_02720 [Roseobacter sp.]
MVDWFDSLHVRLVPTPVFLPSVLVEMAALDHDAMFSTSANTSQAWDFGARMQTLMVIFMGKLTLRRAALW